MPTITDNTLDEDVYRVVKAPGGKFGTIDGRQAPLRFAAKVRLEYLRAIDMAFAVFLVTMIVGLGSINLAWNTSALYSNFRLQNRYLVELMSEVKQYGERIGKLESRMDGIEKQLNVLVQRGEPKPGG